MTLLDSNIIIYAAKPEHAALRQFIAETAPAVSAISATNNLDDFMGIEGLSVFDPLA